MNGTQKQSRTVRHFEWLRLRTGEAATREPQSSEHREAVAVASRAHREDAAAAEGTRLEARDARLEASLGIGAALLVAAQGNRASSEAASHTLQRRAGGAQDLLLRGKREVEQHLQNTRASPMSNGIARRLQSTNAVRVAEFLEEA